MMQKEPAAVVQMIQFLLGWAVQGLVLFEIATFTPEQHAWLTVGASGVIGVLMWHILRTDVWAPAGAPTHPPTEALWSSKVAATEAAGAHALETQKSEYENRLATAAVAVDGEFAAPPAGGRHVAPLDIDVHEAQVDSVNPGQEES